MALTLNLFTIPPRVPFLDAVAADWLGRHTDPEDRARGLILLPTRRAARSLAEAFLRLSEGKPLLLPRITALGALDEAPLALEGALDLPPAIEPTPRLAALTRLILAMNGTNGAPTGADRAWLLAEELTKLMDEAERAEIDLALTLPDAADPAFARHWAETLKFLHIVTDAWPRWLAENGLINPAARQVALLNAQAKAWREMPPEDPVMIAGTTAGVPAVARLLSTVARLPLGQVVFPALDMDMDEAAWNQIDESHPQSGLRRLLLNLDATRGDVQPWPARPGGDVPEGRFPLLSRALLPAEALSSWRASSGEAPPELDYLSRLTTADQQEEAEAIALILRGALESPGARAALVTPDRLLANRVTDALSRYGVVADDSAGEALMDTPPAVFLRLLIRAVADNLAPVSLLALLKHPLAGAGLSEAACRHGARMLEMVCLRGPRPIAGIAGIRMALDKRNAGEELKTYWTKVESCLEPVFRIQASVESAPVEALTAVVAAAERLAATDEETGPARLWSGEEGEALATRLAEVLEAIPGLPDQRRAVLAGLLDAVLRGVAVRERRAVRGRGGALHPRIFIWGLLEARLQSVDLLVLGGLAETVWPPATDPGPWLSRPMRTQMGLPTPEEVIGQAAHDFTAIACSAKEVILSCPTRRDGAPAVPARWLTRLEMYLFGRNVRLRAHPAATWVRNLDLPAGGARAARQPAPRPPVAIRPRRLSVTEIETWLRDPYSIYARHILGLKALKPLDEPTDAADYGTLVHNGMNYFLQTFGARWPPDAYEQMIVAMNRALREAGLRPALGAWWKPRLERIARWLMEADAAHRAAHPLVNVHSEALGRLVLPGPAGDFLLSGKADRIDQRADGTLAILDYKTGTVPKPKDVDAGLAPQLPLEAAMAAAEGFGTEVTGLVTELIYWHLTGGASPGEERALFKKNPAATLDASVKALEGLRSLIGKFDSEEQAYVSQPNSALAPRFSDYAQLARVAEWSSAGESDDDEEAGDE